MNIKFYGGPLHGKAQHITDDALRAGRLEVAMPKLVRPPLYLRESFDSLAPLSMRGPTYDTITYYFRMYTMGEVTPTLAHVRRDKWAAVFEQAELTHREMWDLERDMRNVPWEWMQEPSIVYDFEQWWEKQLHIRGVKKILSYL